MGLYGRTVLQFEATKDMPLPSHNLTPGDIVGLSPSSSISFSELIASGVVSRVTSLSLSVAFDESHEMLLDLDDSLLYKLVKLANDVTYRRMQRALESLNSGHGNGQLINVLFGISEVSIPFELQPESLTFYNEGLDESQKEAVKFALSQREIAIIHGPPGTGKTTTVSEVIQQAVKSGQKVLVCAPSNIAVDNLVEKLSVAGVPKIVRLGHPARLLPSIQRYSLDAILASSEEMKLVEDVRSDINKALLQLKRLRDYGDRQRVRNDIKSLRRELRARESTAVTDILGRAAVVLGTLTTASDDGPLSALGPERSFDLVVIDECSQALEAACWIPLLQAKRCILAGDHHQLPPTILSERAAKDGLAVTLMERLLERESSAGTETQIVRMLTTQYRMHDSIMHWSSEQMYGGRLTSHPSVAAHLLKDLTNVMETDDTSIPLLLIDTTGCSLNELELVDGESKGNEGEADIVAMHVNNLIASGLSPEDIAVIAPYNLQVELLRLRLSQSYPRLEVKSVDGFQGREKEAVVISLVRSNPKGEVGFLAEDRRINVAVTRARRHLAVICDTDTVCRHAFIKSLIDHITTCGEIRSAEQYIQAGALKMDTRRPQELDSKLRSTSASKPSSNASGGKTAKKPRSANVAPAGTVKEHEQLVGDSIIVAGNKSSEQLGSIKREEFVTVLSEFATDVSQTVHVFPSTLTSHDRFLVHEISEHLGLVHISCGEGSDRHIQVSKTSTVASDCIIAQPATVPLHEVAVPSLNTVRSTPKSMATVAESDSGGIPGMSNDSASSVNLVRCPVCHKELLASNLQLHSVQCSKKTAACLTAGSNDGRAPAKAVRKPELVHRPNNATGTVRAPDFLTAASLDDDALLEAAARDNRRCHMARCKNSTATLGQLCAFCRRTFCLSHHLAEVHGCGDEAKRHARAVVAREGVIYPGSGVPSKKPNAVRRAQLESKLAGRLNDLADQRKKKSKKDNNKEK